MLIYLKRHGFWWGAVVNESGKVAFGLIVNYRGRRDSAMEATTHTMENLIRRMTPVAAPPEQQAEVAELFRALEKMAHPPKRRAPKCQLVGPNGETIALPASVFYVLERVAEVLARGDSITVVPVGREMTTQQAADLVNVSRQYLVRLLDEGRIAFRKTGKHRRLRIEDVLEFKNKRDKDRRAGLRELSQITQAFGGYDAELK
jgi:excisionase family DNA binding protein